MNKLSELADFGRLVHEALQLPVFTVDPGQRIDAEHADRALRTSPYYATIRDQLAGVAYALHAAERPNHFTRARLRYFFVNARDGDRLAGTLVVGPYLHDKPQEDPQGDDAADAAPAGNSKQLLDLYEALAVVPPEQARAMSLMIYYAVHRRLADLSEDLTADSAPALQPAVERRAPDAELSRGRRSGMLHTNLAHERVMLRYVRTGERERIRAFVQEFLIGEDEFGVLAKRSRLRSEKNLMITGIALICRAAVEGGMHEEDAFTLSDFYIQRLEERDSVQEVSAVMTDALFDFVDRVAEVRRGHYSPAVQESLREIANALYGDLTLGRLAERVHLSPNYLSSLFKKEVGLTVSEHVQRERIEEAKRLLALTDDPVADIAAWLNFNDQSYFNKVFKRWAGLTPRAYRQSERRPSR